MVKGRERSRVDKYGEPCVLVVFGATGDLAKRKLFPALYALYRGHKLPEKFAVVGTGRRFDTEEAFLDEVWTAVEQFSRGARREERDGFLRLFHYQKLDVAEAEAFQALKTRVEAIDRDRNIGGNRIFYLSVAPGFFAPIIEELRSNGLIDADEAGWKRALVEKPFGHDLSSARSLNRMLADAFLEENIFRIDHYLGKEMLQNMMAIRFANTLFEPLWNRSYIDHVQITVAETVGVEDRGRYYEKAGATRDMVQNHLLQCLTLTAMEPPQALNPTAIRNEKVKVLETLRPVEMVRGQYGSGEMDGKEIPGYTREKDVHPDSHTETFAALKLLVDDDRWQGVPFYLRTGKRLGAKTAQILIEFKTLPHVALFQHAQSAEPNVLVLKIQPEEGVYLQFNGKRLGERDEIVPVDLDYCQNCEVPERSPEAYERLLSDAFHGDSTLFTRWDEVELSWAFTDAIVKKWGNDASHLHVYAPGTWGPMASDQMIERDGRKWRVVM